MKKVEKESKKQVLEVFYKQSLGKKNYIGSLLAEIELVQKEIPVNKVPNVTLGGVQNYFKAESSA